jgi:hypothetical protein
MQAVTGNVVINSRNTTLYFENKKAEITLKCFSLYLQHLKFDLFLFKLFLIFESNYNDCEMFK